MADLIKKIKIKKQDGTFTDYIPIGAEAKNVDTIDGESVQLKLNKKPYYYNTIADMKADTKLKAGDMAVTLGYHEANDGGGATYKIKTRANDDVVDEEFIISLENNLLAELIVNEFLLPEQIGAYGDAIHDDVIKIQHAINSNYKIIGNKNYLISLPLSIGAEKNVEFNGNITYSGNDSAIKIDGRIIKCKFNKIIASKGICLNIGSTLFTQGFEIIFNSIFGNIPIKIGGNSTGTLDGTLTGQFITFITNAIKIDLSNKYVGQVRFYNMRIEPNASTDNYAIDIDCTHTSCTGLSFNNVSFEGNMNGLHAYNMTSTNSLQTLYMDNIRIAELSYQFSKKAICFETTGENDSAHVRGYINFDGATSNAFDFSNYRPSSINTFKGYGSIAINANTYWREFSAGYKTLNFITINKIFRTTWVPEQNEPSSKLIIVDKDGARTNYHPRYKINDVFYLLFEVNGTFELRLGSDSTKYTRITGTTGDLFLVDIFPTDETTGNVLVSKISTGNTLTTY